MKPIEIPEFRPHPLLRGPHVQTLAGFYLPAKRIPYRAVPYVVTLPDGDQLVLHEDCPPDWQRTDGMALLMHGLAGCHRSGYMIRIADKLCAAGVRVFRMDLRGCGAGAKCARLPYHAGRSDDALAAVHYILGTAPDSALALVGFSLSGNVLLKLLGEAPGNLPLQITCAAAVNPPIDLAACVARLERPGNRFYDRHFVKLLNRHVRLRRRWSPDSPDFPTGQRPRRLFDFDDWFTAPVCGYGTAAIYYAQCSAEQFVPAIRIPTLILTSRDDPLVPAEPFESLALPPCVRLHLTEHGGHLGYVGRRNGDPDGRWMDWRIVDWVTGMRDRG